MSIKYYVSCYETLGVKKMSLGENIRKIREVFQVNIFKEGDGYYWKL